jgi:hypothetical protein
MTLSRIVNRRAFTALSGGFIATLATSRVPGVSGHEATPVAIEPMGFVSMRLRVLTRPEARAEVNALVVSDLLPEVTDLPGYGGYVLADVLDVETQSVAVVVFQDSDQLGAFNDAAAGFVESVGDRVDAAATQQWAGDLLMKAAPSAEAEATPVAASAGPLTSGYAAVRVHTSLPGTDPRDFVPEAVDGFLPLITVLPGFRGYLWFPVEGGFAAITLYDSEESATASSEAAVSWATEHLAAYTDGNPTIINAGVIYSDLPVLA